MMCGGRVQVGAARGAWRCRKVPCVVHNGVRKCMEHKGAHICSAGGCNVVRGGAKRCRV